MRKHDVREFIPGDVRPDAEEETTRWFENVLCFLEALVDYELLTASAGLAVPERHTALSVSTASPEAAAIGRRHE
jgi:hypothetical protein